MGDFDKNSTANAEAEKKKLAAVGVLGAVLVAVLAIHFMKGSPGAAAAAVPGTQDEVSAMSEETPEQAAAALLDDPTAKLLRGTPNLDTSLEKAPHNPFILNPEWRATLVKATAPQPKQPVYVATPAAPSQPINTDTLKLTGIFRQGNILCAIINGHILTTGATFDDIKILEITQTEVTLQRAGDPNAPQASLTIQPKLQ